VYGVTTNRGETWDLGGVSTARRQLEETCAEVQAEWSTENACPVDEATTIFRALATPESCVLAGVDTIVGTADDVDISLGMCTDSSITDEAACVGARAWLGRSGATAGVDISGNNKNGADATSCAAAGGTYTPAVIDATTPELRAALKNTMTDPNYFPGNGESCTVKSTVTGRAVSKAMAVCGAVRNDTTTTFQVACEALPEVCTYSAPRNSGNGPWYELPLCNLLVNTGRPLPADSLDDVLDLMGAVKSHDAVATGAATGVLDASDFNKMLSQPIFKTGWFLFYVFCTFYLFCGIAIVCDDFFTASLEILSIKFNLSEDVAGATFMAAGSSAPELFTSLSAVIVQDTCANRNSVGIGTIVGSAIFNILVIIGATCMLAGQVLQLGWKPMIRDTCWYATSIALLVIFVLPESVASLKEKMVGYESLLQDNQIYSFDKNGDGEIGEEEVSNTGLVTWWEGLIMWVAYLGYILFMHFNEQILGETSEEVVQEAPAERVRRKSVAGDEDDDAAAAAAAASKDVEANPTAKADDDEKAPGGDDEEDGDEDCLGVPKEEGMDQVFIWFSYPWYIFFKITIPDCEDDSWKTSNGKEWFAIWFSFINSIIWIGFICYGMVEFAILIGQMCDISSTVMGLTVLSAGTSVPDAISSIVVAQRGLGDMAISNALGSNVFDILLGLGFPYFLSALMEGHPVMMCVDDVSVYLVCLVVVLIIVVGTFTVFKFQLRPIMGIILIVVYILFFLMAVLRDQDVLDLGVACDAGH
jgi:Ca2+/Na+ antiporter